LKQHNDELHNLYSSTNIIKIIKWKKVRWAGHKECEEKKKKKKKKKKKARGALVSKPEVKRSTGNSRYRGRNMY
jgi:hypothetical protein